MGVADFLQPKLNTRQQSIRYMGFIKGKFKVDYNMKLTNFKLNPN